MLKTVLYNQLSSFAYATGAEKIRRALLEPDSDLVLFVDETLLAVNKPANVSVIHDSLRPAEITLVDMLKASYGRLWVVHRLDRETSGVILFARTEQAHRCLNRQFQERKVKKTYHLLAYGTFQWDSIVVDLPLLVDGDRQHRTIISLPNGKPARTEFKLLNSIYHGFFYVQAEPKTGYTHQIRAHLSSLNGAILCDRLYKPYPFPPSSEKPFNISSNSLADHNLPIRRLALHARSISFFHPISVDESMEITAPFPDDFQQTLEKLK